MHLTWPFCRSSFAAGHFANADDDYSAVFSFRDSTEHCESMGSGSVNVCVDSGFYVNGVEISSSSNNDAGDSVESTLDSSNSMSSPYAFIGGGYGNTVSAAAAYAAVTSGYNNIASGYAAFVGGGGARTSDGTGGNVVSGDWSAVLGGFSNTASGTYVFGFLLTFF